MFEFEYNCRFEFLELFGLVLHVRVGFEAGLLDGLEFGQCGFLDVGLCVAGDAGRAER